MGDLKGEDLEDGQYVLALDEKNVEWESLI